MFSQDGLIGRSNPHPLRLDFLKKCLTLVAEEVRRTGGSIHGHKIGSGLGGGKWEEIEEILKETLEGSM